MSMAGAGKPPLKSHRREKPSGVHKWHMAHPPPGSSQFIIDYFKDMRTVFELADTDGDGYLTKPQAADWFRTVGFCMTTAAIESLILSRIVTNHSLSKFNFREMLQAADKSQKLHGFNMGSVEDALTALSSPRAASSTCPPASSGSGRIARSRLKEALTSIGDEPLSEEEFHCLMKILGIGESDFPSNHLERRRISERLLGILDVSVKPAPDSLDAAYSDSVNF
ncbi:hypothetical protein FOZ62_009335 [Perkinsus olseni]|uniref:EF-hand domain-containing protein n=1 Tax=Perkinsus olseni TaxID=32597 RepID=A0A7J6PGM0_PEROL|nr:hypothetical protein FOZ62_009335 [Perkinsus olseni]